MSRNTPRTDLGWWTIEQKNWFHHNKSSRKKCFVEKLDNVAPSLWSTPLVTGSPRFPHRARKPCCEPTVPQQAHTMQVIDVSSNRLGLHSLRGKVHSVGHRTTPTSTVCTQWAAAHEHQDAAQPPSFYMWTCGSPSHHNAHHKYNVYAVVNFRWAKTPSTTLEDRDNRSVRALWTHHRKVVRGRPHARACVCGTISPALCNTNLLRASR